MTKNCVSDALRAGLRREAPLSVRALLMATATAVFFAFARFARYAMIDDFSGYRVDELANITAAMFTAIYALSLAVQLRIARRMSVQTLLLISVITGAVLLGKISLLDYISDDYEIFLSNWIYEYSQLSLREGLGRYIGSDYSPPYLYILQLISRLDSYPWQYAVKAASMLFEVLMAWAIARLVSLRRSGAVTQLIAFHLATLLPTVVFNGAYWGQCDVIYVSLCLTALYMALTRRSRRCMLLFGAALSFKLQTVFFMPALLGLWLRREIRLRDLWLIPAGYMGMMLPALLGGKSLHHVLTVYLQQAGHYNFMSVNAPNLYQFLPGLDRKLLYSMFSPMAMALGFAFLLCVCAVVCHGRARLTQEGVLLCCLLLLAGVPYFLPKMHERYTFGADVLSLALAVINPRCVLLPLCFGFASYVCYTSGLAGEQLMALQWAALFQLAGIVMTAAALLRSLRVPEQITEVKA